MKKPYKIEELDALMKACIDFTDQQEEVKFYAGNISGRDGVSPDNDSVRRTMDWIVETDNGLLECLGFGNDNITYFRLGHDAKQMMNQGGFKKYFRKKAIEKNLERLRVWAPIGISLLAAIVSFFAWQAPKKKDNSRMDGFDTKLNEFRNVQEQFDTTLKELRNVQEHFDTQLNELGSNQEKTKTVVTTMKKTLETTTLLQPSPSSTGE